MKSKNNICNECGKSVACGSGNFANRVTDLNDVATRIEMGKPYPDGDYICADCYDKQSIARSFRYLDLLFTPWERASVPAKELLNCNDTPAGWSFIEFYKIADQHYAGNYTTFLVKGKLRVPGTHFLFHYKPR